MKNSIIQKLDNLIISISCEHFNIEDLFNNMNNNSLEEIINHYLMNIKSIKDNDIDLRIADKVLQCFDYNYGISDGDSRIINYSIMEEANIICDDLIKKIKGVNNRSITLPINLKVLMEYSISSYISSQDVNKVIYYLIIKLAIIHSSYK